MADLNIGRLAPDVAALLWKVGGDLPPLLWQDRANPAARKTLDEVDEHRLFGRQELKSDAMASAVKALLYLWNGWPADGSMYGQLAEPNERAYIAALCERHLGRTDAAKKLFQQLDGHPIFSDLAASALKLAGSVAEPSIQRLRQIIALDSLWEPYVFVNLHAMAVAGRSSPRAQEVIRQIQKVEFDLLFAHCYRAATDEDVLLAPTTDEGATRKPSRRIARPSVRTPSPTPKAPARSAPEPARSEPPKLAGTVNVQCPRCGMVGVFAAAACGKTGQCSKCRAHFMIPKRKTGAMAGTSAR